MIDFLEQRRNAVNLVVDAINGCRSPSVCGSKVTRATLQSFTPERISRSDIDAPGTLADDLRHAVRACGQTQFRIALLSDMSPVALSRFMNGRRGLSLASVTRLCRTLGLRLTEHTVGRDNAMAQTR